MNNLKNRQALNHTFIVCRCIVPVMYLPVLTGNNITTSDRAVRKSGTALFAYSSYAVTASKMPGTKEISRKRFDNFRKVVKSKSRKCFN